jgi:hypothetical protein
MYKGRLYLIYVIYIKLSLKIMYDLPLTLCMSVWYQTLNNHLHNKIGKKNNTHNYMSQNIDQNVKLWALRELKVNSWIIIKWYPSFFFMRMC